MPAFRDAEPSGAARPVTVTILTILWGASVFFYGGLGGWLGFAAHLGTVPAIGSGVTCGFFMIMSVIMAAGIWSLSPWARTLQILFAGIGLIVCPITLPSAVILAYFFRTQARVRFSRGPLSASDQETLARDTAEGAFAAALIGTVLIGILLSAGAGFGYTRFFQPRGAPLETPSQP